MNAGRRFVANGGWWVLGQAVLILAVLASPLAAPRAPAWEGPWHRFVGVFLMALGLIAMGAGGYKLGASLTPMPKPVAHGSIRTDGAYRWVRHPIYAGAAMLCLGYALYWPQAGCLAPAVAVAAYLNVKAGREECWLIERYPEYEQYRRRTRRFIPFVY